jgi:hypothetical protein
MFGVVGATAYRWLTKSWGSVNTLLLLPENHDLATALTDAKFTMRLRAHGDLLLAPSADADLIAAPEDKLKFVSSRVS